MDDVRTEGTDSRDGTAGIDHVDTGRTDRTGRRITCRGVGPDTWRAVADVAPHDDQRRFVAPTAARYLLLSTLEDDWRSLGVHADETVVGHVMWAVDDDGSHWIGGVLVDAAEQRKGVAEAATATMIEWLGSKPACDVVRLSYDADNAAAAALYARLGFRPTGEVEDGEVVVELPVGSAGSAGSGGSPVSGDGR